MSTMTIAVELVASSVGADNVSNMVSKVNRLSLVAKGLGGNLKSAMVPLIGFGIAAAGVDSIFGLLLDTVKTGIGDAADLESAITRLQLASGLTGDAFDNLKLAVVDLATHSLYSTTEAAGAFEKLTEMGFNASQVMYGMGAADDAVTAKTYDATAALQGLGRQAMAVGEAMKTDAVTGATLLGTALHTFRHDAMTAAEAANLLVGTFYSGVPSAEAIQQAINGAGAQADAAGIKFHDFVTTLGLLAQAGLPADQAGTALRYMIQSLIAPTNKQADALAYLGIRVTNTTDGLKSLLGEMEKQGGAAGKAAKAYDGSVKSLQEVYTAAKKAGDVPLDGTFNQWAEGMGALNSKLFDSHGQFLGLKNAVQVLDQAMADKKLSMQQKMDIMASLFNVRSGRAAELLTNLDNFKKAYDKEWDKIGKTDALGNAQRVLDTFNGSVQELSTSLHSGLALAFMSVVQNLTPLVQGINNLVGAFLTLDPQTQGFVGITLVLLTVLTGITGVVLTVVTALMALSAIGVAVGSIFLIAGVVFAQVGVWIAIVVGFVIAFKNALDHNKDVQKQFNQALKDIKQALADLKPHWDHLMQTLKQLQPVWDQLKQVLGFIAVVIVMNVLHAIVGFIQFLGFLFDLVSGGIQLWVHFQIQLQLWAMAIKVWFESLPERAQKALSDLKDHVQEKVTDIVKSIEDFVNGIKHKIGDGFEWVKTKIRDAVNTVVGWFKWLYDHNYYFQHLVDFIRQKWNELVGHFNDLKAKAGALWSLFTTFLQTKLHEVLNWISSRFNQGKTDTVNKFNDLKGKAQAIWTVLWDWVQSKIHDALGKVQQALTDAKTWVGNKFNDLKNAAMNVLNGWPKQLFNFGAHALQMFIDGLQSKVGDLIKKLKDIGGQIAGILGFHSPPPEGPLADSDTYMPNMMKMFTDGIEKNAPALKKAAMNVAHSLVLTPNMAGNHPSNSSSGSGGTVVIPVTLDGKQIAQYTLDLSTKTLKQSGSSRYSR